MVLENVLVSHRAVRLYLLILTTGIRLQSRLSSKRAHLFCQIVILQYILIGTFHKRHLPIELPRMPCHGLVLKILIQNSKSVPRFINLMRTFRQHSLEFSSML